MRSFAWLRPADLARNLHHGALCELRLTPKPGLVDLWDSGSHTDVNLPLMVRSVSLLPAYYSEVLEARRRGRGLTACIAAGRRAEERMFQAVGANGHRGYIFLSGLMLLGCCGEGCDSGDLRVNIVQAAEDFFREIARTELRVPADPPVPGATVPTRDRRGERNGERVRREHNLGGIRAEALAGLPSVFEVGLPAFERWLTRSGDFVASSLYLMACLMQQVEDTTAVHRCGPEGLARIRSDGAILQHAIERGADHIGMLTAWNDEYREMNLTMGGVADCLGLTLAVHFTKRQLRESEAGDIQVLLLRNRHCATIPRRPAVPKQEAWTKPAVKPALTPLANRVRRTASPEREAAIPVRARNPQEIEL